MKLAVRYQAAIIQDHQLLLLRVWDHAFTGQVFWVIPGGGRIAGESEEDCVRREALEETRLEVEIDRILLDEDALPEDMYERTRTYLCRIVGGVAQPGTEPEVDTADRSTIQEVGWFDLREPAGWDVQLLNNRITYSLLQRLRSALGYETGAI